jgi:rod shape determining protein RodA
MLDNKATIKKNKMEWPLLGAVVVLLTLGSLAIFSATSGLPFHEKVIRTHFIAIPVGIGAFLFGWSFSHHIYRNQWKILYGLILALMIGVLIFGSAEKGSKSWIHFPLFSVQPSELCRIGLILVVASYLDSRKQRIKSHKTVLGVLALVMPVFALSMKQPDFSSVLVTFPIIIAMLYCAGARGFHLFVILGYGLVSALFPILWSLVSFYPNLARASSIIRGFYALSRFGFLSVLFCLVISIGAYLLWRLSIKFRSNLTSTHFAVAALVIIVGYGSGAWMFGQLKSYQRDRLKAFLAPTADVKGASYNTVQAKIAIGSGGFLGKGVFSGTQSRLGFIPEKHTDFIVAVIGEEMGFVGCIVLLALYLFVIWRILLISEIAGNRYSYIASCGIFSMFAVYLAINFGMSLGLVPVAGVPLPLVSYGGSNLVSTLWALGIVESVYARRFALA